MNRPTNGKPLSSRCVGAAITLLVLVICADGARAEADIDYDKLLADKTPALVTVKFVLKIKSQWGDHDAEREATGAMIASNGLVLCANSHFGGGGWLQGSGATAVPTDIKILIGDDTEGLEATVIARDTDLDLAWVRLKAPSKDKLPSIDLSKAAAPEIGDRLYAVNRLGKYFDRVAVVRETRMGGVASKPRALYIPSGGSGALGLPVFNAAGEVVGVTITQSPDSEEMEASGGYMGGSVVILPAEKAHKATLRALKSVEDEEEAEDKGEEDVEPEEGEDEE